MTRKQLFKLFDDKDLQSRIVSILLSRELVSLKAPEGKYLFSNIELSDIGEELVEDSLITDQFVKEFRDLFPPGKRGDKNLVKERLQTLMMEVKTSKDQVLDAVKMYLSELTDSKYCQHAHYFIEKRLPDGTVRQTIRGHIERLQEGEEDLSPGYGQEIL